MNEIAIRTAFLLYPRRQHMIGDFCSKKRLFFFIFMDFSEKL